MTRLTGPTLTVAEVAELLDIHRTHLYSMIRRGEFPVPVVRVGKNIRISRRAFDEHFGTATAEGPPSSAPFPGAATKIPIPVLEAFCDFADEAIDAIRRSIAAHRAMQVRGSGDRPRDSDPKA